MRFAIKREVQISDPMMITEAVRYDSEDGIKVTSPTSVKRRNYKGTLSRRHEGGKTQSWEGVCLHLLLLFRW